MIQPAKLLRTAVLTAALTCLCIVGASAASLGVGTVEADALRLRDAAAADGAILATAAKGDAVIILEDAGNNWYKVDYKSVEGYMSGEYLTVSEKADVAIGYGLVQTDGATLNMRSGPGTSYDKVAVLSNGAVVDIVGKVLTPLLLLGLTAIIVKGIVTPLGTIAAETKIDSAVVTGVKSGYQTMDALAALPFGILVLQSVVDKGYTEPGKKFRIMSGSSILACVLLLAVYMGLAYLGATVSAQYTSEIGRAQLVMAIVEALMGKTGMILFGIVVGLACVTTAVALTSSAAAYFAKLCRGKVSYPVFVIAICVFSAVVSNLGLDRIVAIAAPVLDIVYPPTLVLIFIALVRPQLPDRISRGAALGALLMSVLCTLDGYGVPLTFLHKLPMFDLGFAWVLPAVLFGAAAALLPVRRERTAKAKAERRACLDEN